MVENEEKLVFLEDLVSQVDYSTMFDKYVPTEYAFRVINTIKLINGDKGEENKTPLVHYKMLDSFVTNPSTLNIASRGLAKTSLVEYIVFDLALYGELPNFGDVMVMMYVSDTIENGVKSFFMNMKFRYEYSSFLQEFIPNVRFTQEEAELENKAGHKLAIKGFGVSTGIRGFRRYNQRPTIALLDDLMSDKNAQSPTVVQDIEDVIYKAIEQALHPTKRKVMWSGTPFTKKDPLYKAAGSDAWTTNVFPVANKFPCTKEEFIGAWEDRFTFDAVNSTYQKLRSLGKEDNFAQEMMLRIMNEEDKLVKPSDIVWYDSEFIINNKYHYNWYITTDFATTEKQGADFSGIFVWAYTSNGEWLLVDGYLERLDMAKNINRLFEYVRTYEPIMGVGIEITGQQRGFVSWIKEKMIEKSMFFTLASDKSSKEEGIRPVVNKLQRFNNVLPLFKTKKIWFPKKFKETKFMTELLDELTNITKGGIKSAHDDGIDCVSMLGSLDAWKPSSSTASYMNRPVSPNFEINPYNTNSLKDLTDDYSNYSSPNPYIV